MYSCIGGVNPKEVAFLIAFSDLTSSDGDRQFMILESNLAALLHKSAD